MDDFKHGRKGYLHNRCRCEICKEAASIYRKELRLRNGSDVDLRLPAEPLLRLLEKDGRIGEVHSTKLKRWKENGMSVYWADYWAVHFGWHPAEIWGMDFYKDIKYPEVA